MAFLTLSMYSEVLHLDTNVNVILPEQRKTGKEILDPDRKYPVLYLLHGMGDDHTAWSRKSTIELIARECNLVVVMPTVGCSSYVNQVHGLNYYDYMTKELPVKMANFFPVSLKREDTFIAGNSMGGYGALRIALGNPDKYAGAASLSGALTPYGEYETEEEREKNVGGKAMKTIRMNTFGTMEEYLASDNNLVNLVEKLRTYDGEKPKLFICCGTDDPITYTYNKAFLEAIKDKELDYYYEESPGSHNWAYWNPKLQQIFDFFGIYAVGNTIEGAMSKGDAKKC